MLESVFFPFAESLDNIRTLLLKTTLKLPFLRSVFVSRPMRTTFIFSTAVLINLFLSVFFPLWLLVVGPILWGFPHLVSSLRFVGLGLFHEHPSALKPRSPNTMIRTKVQRWWFFAFFLFVGISFFRLQTDWFGPSSRLARLARLAPGYMEWYGAILVWLSFVLFLRTKFNFFQFGVTLLLGGLFTFGVKNPVVCGAALMIAHHFVGFFYWISASRTKQDLRVAVVALFIFAVIHLLIFGGVFDGLYHFFIPTPYLPFADLRYEDLGKSIVPYSPHYQVWFHAVVAYAFGQAMHYALWVKILGDQHTETQAPASFRMSLTLLQRDFGAKLALIILFGLIFGVAIWAFVKIPQARVIYFSIASFHGFMEIAGLPFLRLKWTSK